MMSNDLFVRLSKYSPRAGKSAIENFFTELVGHLLAGEGAARQEFLGFLPPDLADGLRDAQVTTQYSTESRNTDLAQLRPDLMLRSGGLELVVENKVDDKLGEKQLRQYLDYAQERVATVNVFLTVGFSPMVIQRACGDNPNVVPGRRKEKDPQPQNH